MLPSLMLALAPLVTAGGDELPFSLAKLPADVERLVARLHSAERLSKDEAEVAKRDCFRPYFPLLVLKDVGLKEGTARTVFVDFYLARHKERRDGWAKAGRLDLIIESQVVCARGDDGLGPTFAAEWTEVLTDLVNKKAAGVVKAKVKGNKERQTDVDDRFTSMDEFVVRTLGKRLGNGRFDHIAAAPVVSFDRFKPGQTPDGVIDIKNGFGNAACFADRIEFVSTHHVSSLFVAAGEMWIDRSDRLQGLGHDHSLSAVVTNGSADCGQLQQTLVIADGDIHLHDGLHGPYIAIARGDIHTEGRLTTTSSLLVAGGKIAGKKLVATRHGYPVGMLLAKGSLELADEKESKMPDPNREKGVILDGVGPADLGVRWFELADMGLEVVADGKTAVVKAVAEKSPFHKHLQAKDVLREINAVAVATPDAARRALRRAYILGFAVVTFEREGKTASKLVPIDDLTGADPKK